MWVATFMGLSAVLVSVEGSIIVYTQTAPHTIQEEFRDLPADFGPEIAPEGMRGFLVQGVPSDGCTNMTGPPAVDNFTDKWIVLIAINQSTCQFETQVRNAQAAGFHLAIVHNVNSSELVEMNAENEDGIEIPSVFVSGLAGFILTEEYLYDKGFYIMVNGDLPFNINTHLLLPFAIVVVLCLISILIFMIVKCIKDRRRARRHRLPNRSLKKIPTCKFSKGDPYETCAICLDDYQEGERLRVLPCAHAYHAACIDPWLTQSRRVCPVCKRRVFAAGERRRVHSDSDTDDTEPLLAAPPPSHTVTMGGTFDEQRENPFARATRFMARLRARAQNGEDAEVASTSSEDNNVNTNNDENGNTEDTQPLVTAPAVAAVERPRGAGRSERRRMSAARRAARPDRRARNQHSINTDSRGEIGVAALPAAAAPASPHHYNL